MFLDYYYQTQFISAYKAKKIHVYS